MLIHLHNKKFTQKPDNAPKIINEMFDTDSIVNLSAEQICHELLQGKTIIPGNMTEPVIKVNNVYQRDDTGKPWKCKTSWSSQQLLLLDCDSGCTPETVKNIAKTAGIPFAFIYKTFNWTVQKPKFRCAIVLPYAIDDIDVMESLTDALTDIFCATSGDPSTFNMSMMFYGARPDGLIEADYDAVMPDYILEGLIEKGRQKVQYIPPKGIQGDMPDNILHEILADLITNCQLFQKLDQHNHLNHNDRVLIVYPALSQLGEVGFSWLCDRRDREQTDNIEDFNKIKNRNYQPMTCEKCTINCEKYKTVQQIIDASRARAMVDKVDAIADISELREPDKLKLVATLKRDNPLKYHQFGKKLKATRALNEAIKKYEVDVQNKQPTEPQIKYIEINGIKYVIPPKWMLDVRAGIYLEKLTENGAMLEMVSNTPMAITRTLMDCESHETKVELAYIDRGTKWRTKIIPRQLICKSQDIIILSKFNLNVNTLNATKVIGFLAKWEEANKNIIPLVRCVSHFGWCGGNFLPGLPGDLIVNQDAPEMEQIAEGVHESGTLQDWLNQVDEFRGYPMVRFLVGASLISPFLGAVGMRSFVIHLWCKSRSGKTAAQWLAISAWGDPNKLIPSSSSTIVAIEHRAGIMRNLPMAINELQALSADKRENRMNDLIYMVGNECGKDRGRKDGGNQRRDTWKSIWTSSGEEPIAGETRTAGIDNRLIELDGIPIADPEQARKIYHHTFWGTAGPEFVRRIVKYDLRGTFEKFMTCVRLIPHDCIESQLEMVGICCFGDYLVNYEFFGMADAWQRALMLVNDILALGGLVTPEDYNEAGRVYEKLQSWIGYYQNNFNDFATNEGIINRFGYHDNNKKRTLIYSFAFDRFCRETGFKRGTALRNMALAGMVVTTKGKDGKKRNQVAVRKNGKVEWFIAVKMPEASQDEESDN